MEWISQYLNSLYSPCKAEPTILPPVKIQQLSPIISTDCKGCEKPCTHPTVPEHLKIDQSQPLQNTVPPYAMHLILMTGSTQWPAQIEQEGLAYALVEGLRKQKESRHTKYCAYNGDESSDRVVVTCCSLPSRHSTQRRAMDVLLMPDNIIFSNITPRRVEGLLDYIFARPCTQTFSVYPCPWASLFLVCGHGSKDKRCGTVGPMLQLALQQAVKEGTQVALVSHLGGKFFFMLPLFSNYPSGHAFAGNLVVYTHYGQRAIWYGRVTPCYCQEIVDNSLQDKVIEELVRGVFQVQSKPTPNHLDW